MNVQEILVVKRDGGELSAEQIAAFVQGVVHKSVPDYQQAAWLMAVYLRGMNDRETLDLTLAMRDSGERIDLSGLTGGLALDKHSTGGVGDKTTLVVVPILAACGVPMLKMSGRGLGHSGGTVDKLEAIPGFRTNLTIAEAKAQVGRIGAALIAQTAQLAPCDGALYALRDVTATVESIPLIASSIMSKKLASGGQRIVLDVKVGRGAFMPTRARAEELARLLVAIGNASGVPTSALLTEMDEPLGFMVGNALEVREAIQTLRSAPETEPRFRALCLDLSAHALHFIGRAGNPEEACIQAEECLCSGRAADKFAEIIAAQGGPTDLETVLNRIPKAPLRRILSCDVAGWIEGIDAEGIGKLAVEMGAGRRVKSDPIDPSVGIELHVKTGQRVTPGATLATLHLSEQRQASFTTFLDTARDAFHIAEKAPPAVMESLILASYP